MKPAWAAVAPLRITYRAEYNDHEVMCYSPKFEPVPLGQVVPDYNLIVRRDSQVEPAYIEAVERAA